MTRDSLIEQNCHVCGEGFEEKDTDTAINLGPIGAGANVVNAHEHCYTEALTKHPEVLDLVGKIPINWTIQDKEAWSSAFSGVTNDSLFGKLFSKK